MYIITFNSHSQAQQT